MNSAERIAFVCPRFASGKTLGGAETLLKNLALRAARAGRHVTFLSTCATNHFTWANELPPGPRTENGLPVILFPVDSRDETMFLRIQDRISHGRTITEDEERAWLRNSVNSSELCDYLRRHAGDFDRIVTGPYLFGLTLAVAAIQPDKTSLVPCLHNEPFAYLSAVARMFRETPRILFNSRPERDLACRLYGIDPSTTFVVGMGIDPVDVPPDATPRCPAPSVIYCGRREPLKGTPLLVDYMAAFRSRTRMDVKIVLTGSGPVDLSTDMQPHVIDMGLLTEEQKWAAMASATVFCHPSRNESLGIVLLEAWLAGTPALVRADSEVLRDHCERSGGGLWFRTYPEFEEELILLLQNESLRTAMRDAGNAYVRREYSWESIQAKLLDALDG